MNVRRSATALAALAMTPLLGLAGVSGAPYAVADDAPPASAPASSSAPATPPSGLFGTSDPTYDGVFRQSYAMIAQVAAGQVPGEAAVDWLVGQQCADGGFAAYRADPGKACDAKTPRDSNSTAAAVEALGNLRGAAHKAAVDKAVTWLKSVQNDDGGWGYSAGLPSDANSTGLAVGALVAAGEDPADEHAAKGGKSPYDALAALAMPCAEGGAFGLRDAESGKLTANADATAAGVLGGFGRGAVVNAAGTKPTATASGAPSGNPSAGAFGGAPSGASGSPSARNSCKDRSTAVEPHAAQAARNGAGYLVTQLARTHYLESSLPGATDQPDYGNTADAVVALAAAGEDEAAGAACRWLAQHALDWAEKSGPAGYAELILAAHAARFDPRHFGGTDLVHELGALGPPAHAAAFPGSEGAAEDSTEDGGSAFGAWTVAGVVLGVVVIAALLLWGLRARRRP